MCSAAYMGVMTETCPVISFCCLGWFLYAEASGGMTMRCFACERTSGQAFALMPSGLSGVPELHSEQSLFLNVDIQNSVNVCFLFLKKGRSNFGWFRAKPRTALSLGGLERNRQLDANTMQ